MSEPAPPKQIAVERTIEAPPDVVWELISDVTRMGDWSPETVGCRWLGDAEGPEVGARFKGRNRNGWHRWSTVSTVTEAERGRSFVFLAKAGPLPIAEWGYRLTPTATGCTVTETWDDRRGGLMKAVGRPASGVRDRVDHNRAGMEATLERLAESAERRTPAS